MSRDAWQRVLFLSGALFLWCSALPMAPTAEGDLDRDEVQAELDNIKQRLLANLGLSRVPDVSKANVSEAEMARMLEIYRRSVAESREADDEDDENEDDDDRAVHRFYSYKDTAPLNRTTGWQHLFFPLQISNQNGSAQRHFSSHSAKLRLHRLCHGQRATASLYQLLEPWDGSDSTDRLLVEERKLRPKRNAKIPSWQVPDNVFDLSRPVSTWLESPSLNYGLLLQCSTSGHPRRHQYTSSRAVLDILVKERPRRQKRSRPFAEFKGRHNIRKDCTSSNKTNVCCRYSLKVTFKEIDWDFVMQPKDFQANFCRGRCPYDAGKVTYASNHAILQSFINLHGKTVPKPCCVPKKLRSLSVMHLNDKDPPEMVVTRYKGMIVNTCACS